MLTNYKIIGALYVQPYTYQQLWRATKIQRNMLRQRLDQLVKDNIIIKHHHAFRPRILKGSRDFYLLNWANKQSKEIVSSIFDDPLVREANLSAWCRYTKQTRVYIINSSTSMLSYRNNFILQVKPSEREYTLVQPGALSVPSVYFLSTGELWEKAYQLYKKEEGIFEQIRLGIATSKPDEEIFKLIEERDSILESIVLLYARYAIPKYAGRNASLFHLDMLILFSRMLVFTYWTPYAKYWEIMERVGYI
jgi:DNA-binding Lrp family transcriptional regulator